MSMINATNKNLDDLRGVVQLLWGVDVQEDTFRRWTQGLLCHLLYNPNRVIEYLLGDGLDGVAFLVVILQKEISFPL